MGNSSAQRRHQRSAPKSSDRSRLFKARALLRIHFYEMFEDLKDGAYDCTCSHGDPCQLHRVAAFLGDGAEDVLQAYEATLVPGVTRG